MDDRTNAQYGSEPAFARLYADALRRAAKNPDPWRAPATTRRLKRGTADTTNESSASTVALHRVAAATSTNLTAGATAIATNIEPSVASATTADAAPEAEQPVTTLLPVRLPAPLDYHSIKLLDKDASGSPISYTDCMESSCLRFVQAMLCDAKSLDTHGHPTRVDLDLVQARVKHAALRDFFAEYPEILPNDAYAPGCRGFKAREAWAQLVIHRPFFTYKRSACGLYKNEWLEGDATGTYRWATEMEPCVHNVISLCRHFLGVDFAKEDAAKPMWNRRCDTNHECLTHDVSADAKLHLAAAMRQLSRPGLMELRARVELSGEREFCGMSRYDTDITLEVNGVNAWVWSLRRKFVEVPLAVLRAVGGDKNEEASKTHRVRTSWHSEIRESSE